MTPRIASIFPACLAALAGLVLALPGAMAGEEFTVATKRVQDLKSVFATVRSVDLVAARARIGGTVRGLAVDEGSRVTAGQIIARVGDPKLGLGMAVLDARGQSLKARLDLARIALKRAQSLRKSGAGSQARLDETGSNLQVVERDMAVLAAERAVIAQRQAEGAVRAPDGGRVLRVHVTDGTVVMAGETIATIARETYILRMHLPERHARSLKVGDRVRVGTRGLGRRAADGSDLRTGRVRQVYPQLDRGRVVADVAVEGLGGFFVGERIRVYVPTGVRETMVVPAAYLTIRHGLTFVRLKDGGQTVVQTGQPLSGGIEVLSGLMPGDVLLLPARDK